MKKVQNLEKKIFWGREKKPWPDTIKFYSRRNTRHGFQLVLRKKVCAWTWEFERMSKTHPENERILIALMGFPDSHDWIALRRDAFQSDFLQIRTEESIFSKILGFLAGRLPESFWWTQDQWRVRKANLTEKRTQLQCGVLPECRVSLSTRHSDLQPVHTLCLLSGEIASHKIGEVG